MAGANLGLPCRMSACSQGCGTRALSTYHVHFAPSPSCASQCSDHLLGTSQRALSSVAVRHSTLSVEAPSKRFAGEPSARHASFSREASAHAQASVGEGQLPRTWSNPEGEVLTEVIPGVLWTADRPFVWNGIDVGGRMGVVRLQDGSLWVHSPVELDSRLADALAALGPVRHIVSPNFEHCKYAQQWIAHFPDAIGYACPGLQEARPDIQYTAAVGRENTSPQEWMNEFETTFFDCERNPFTHNPFFNEVLFFHAPSGALFVTDLFWNYPESGLPLGSALWKLGMDRVYLPFYKLLMITDRLRFRNLVDRVLQQDWSTLIPCHGSVIRVDAKAALRKHLLA